MKNVPICKVFPAGTDSCVDDLPYTVFDTGPLDGFKGAVNRWLVGCFLELVFLFSKVQVLVGLYKQFINNFVFLTWACAAGFNNNNKDAWGMRIAERRKVNERIELGMKGA